MNTRDLMINDWVLYTEFGKNEFHRIENVEPTRVWLKGCKTYIPDVLIDAIPLTPEILQKNGFALKPDGWLYCEDKGNEEQDYIFIQFRKGCDGIRICELNFIGKVQATFRQIQYVHELQHALRLCGIEKDIVL